MIEIKTEGTKVIATINPALSCNRVPMFVYEAGDLIYAELLMSRLRKQMWNAIEEIRRTEYESGWSDHRKKKHKREWFASSWHWRPN